MQIRHTLSATVAVAAIALLTFGCSSTSDMTDGPGGAVRVVMSAGGEAPATASLDPSGTPEAFGDTSGGSLSGRTLQPADGDDHGDDERRIKGILMTLTDIKARNAVEGTLEDVTVDLPADVDLLQLIEDGGQVDLGVGSLPPGLYDQLVIVVESLTLIARNDTEIRITPPGGGWTRIVRVEPFEVMEGETVTIQIRIRPKFFFKLGDRIDDVHHGDFDCDFDVDVDDDD